MKQQVENFIYLDAVTNVVDKHEEEMKRILKQQELMVDRIQTLENRCKHLRLVLIVTSIIFLILLFSFATVIFFMLG